jgi:hypothetical protein
LRTGAFGNLGDTGAIIALGFLHGGPAQIRRVLDRAANLDGGGMNAGAQDGLVGRAAQIEDTGGKLNLARGLAYAAVAVRTAATINVRSVEALLCG